MSDIQKYPPPWVHLKATLYMIPWWISSSEAKNLPDIAYSPLEASSGFAGPEGGRPVGGMGSIQIVRYSETPVGPYDELLIAPGNHEYVVEEDGKRKTRRNTRITRIYVSQKHTCYNGRNNWNLPKHLAKFDFQETPEGTTVKVFPHDTTDDPMESQPSDVPLFQATFKAQRFIPSFPLDTNLAKYVGVDLHLAQPPLPQGKGGQGELCGTERWCRNMPRMTSKTAHMGWFDMLQPEERAEGVGEHFWPGFKRHAIAVRMDNCDISLLGEEYWDSPKSVE